MLLSEQRDEICIVSVRTNVSGETRLNVSCLQRGLVHFRTNVKLTESHSRWDSKFSNPPSPSCQFVAHRSGYKGGCVSFQLRMRYAHENKSLGSLAQRRSDLSPRTCASASWTSGHCIKTWRTASFTGDREDPKYRALNHPRL